MLPSVICCGPPDAQGWWRIGWSFYAAAMGSWALFSPGSYAYYAGILGLAMYAFASGVLSARSHLLRLLPLHFCVCRSHLPGIIPHGLLPAKTFSRAGWVSMCPVFIVW